MVNFIIKELGLTNVLYCAYSGMAASVLTRKGNPATTIHRTIYNTVKIYDNEKKKHVYIQKLKERDEFEGVELIVIDEWSMVPDKMIDQIESFGIKCLYCGDPEQLPPIFGDNKLVDCMDFFLDEVHRQALDNPIIYISMLARNKQYIDYGNYGNDVKVVRKLEVKETNLARLAKSADQVLCGKNATCKYINDIYRAYNLDIYPEDNKLLPEPGEKIMCLKNNWGNSVNISPGIDINLVNGVIGYMDNIDRNYPKAKAATITFKPSFSDDYYMPIVMDELPFLDPKVDKKGDNALELYPELQMYRMDNSVENLDYFDFAYGITTHKSQGSEFNKVLYIEEVLNKKTHYRMLYTAITRAKEKLIILR